MAKISGFLLLLFYIQLFCLGIGNSSGQFEDEVAYNSTELAFDMYKIVYATFPSENLVFSPFALQMTLSLLYFTSYNITEKEIQEASYFTDIKYTHGIHGVILSDFITNPYVKLGQRIYVQNTLQLNSSFMEAVSEYQGSIQFIDFKESEKLKNDMNSWINDQTNGLITELLAYKNISSSDKFVILNSLYLNNYWKRPFSEDSVKAGKFIGIDKKEYDVQFMSGTEEYNNVMGDPELKADVVEINYVSESYMSFWIVLPHISSSLTEIMQTLSTEYLDKVFSKMKLNVIEITMPKFECDSSIDAKKLFIDMGIKSLNGGSELNILQNSHPIEIDLINMRTKIIASTNGTEQGLEFDMHEDDTSSTEGIVPIALVTNHLRVDRPFIYMIVVRRTKQPIFIGHFVKPKT